MKKKINLDTRYLVGSEEAIPNLELSKVLTLLQFIINNENFDNTNISQWKWMN